MAISEALMTSFFGRCLVSFLFARKRQTLVAFLNPNQQSLHREDDSVMGVMSGFMRNLRR